MNHMSNYLKNKVLKDHLKTTPVYIALFNNDVEVSQASYARQAVAFADPVDGQTSNASDVLFPIASESWGTITHVGIYDALTGGNPLFRSQTEFSKSIEVSSQYKIPKNYLIIRIK